MSMAYSKDYWYDYLKDKEIKEKDARELLNLDIYSLMSLGDSLTFLMDLPRIALASA